MQSLQDIHDKIFFETKSILETLCRINSKDELLAKQDLFAEVTDRIAFLRILEKNEDSFDFADDTMEEEVKFTNDLNDFEDEIETEEKMSSHPLNVENPIESNEMASISESDVSNDDEISLNLGNEGLGRRTIVEFDRHETLIQTSEITEYKIESLQQQAEKKFKLASIKGLKVMQELFDNDLLEEEKIIEEPQIHSGSLIKSNVKTDFMEAERKKQEFKLDLNDKVAFSKSLFAGNDEELKNTIANLNSFGTLEEAKQYLSEIYYKKDWSKADEYAQRLWNLVENKFM